MLEANTERSFQTASTPFNIFEDKGNVESLLGESPCKFKIDSTRFQQTFNVFYTLNRENRQHSPSSTQPTLKHNPIRTLVRSDYIVADQYMEYI